MKISLAQVQPKRVKYNTIVKQGLITYMALEYSKR